MRSGACRLLFRSGEAALHPLAAVVRFQMEPSVVFAGGTDVGLPGEHYVGSMLAARSCRRGWCRLQWGECWRWRRRGQP